MKKRHDLRWGAGETTLFLAPSRDGLMLLDYEFDHEQIHERCGGKRYYISRSGNSGAGYICNMSDLVRVGYYRVDTAHNEFQYPENIAKDVSIMLPYASHTADKEAVLNMYPVVIVNNNTVIYCDFYENMAQVLDRVLSGEELKQSPRVLKRTLIHKWSCVRNPQDVELKFYNLFGFSYNPWEFVTKLLEDYRAQSSYELVHRICRIGKLDDGTLVRTARVGNTLCATEEFHTDPCRALNKAIPGWELAETNMLYKVKDDNVYIIGWKVAETAILDRCQRIARFLPDAKRKVFLNFAKENLPESEFMEYEISVPKLLFVLNKEKQFATVRKGIANKVRQEARYLITSYIKELDDERILEAIPDDLVITAEYN